MVDRIIRGIRVEKKVDRIFREKRVENKKGENFSSINAI